MKKKLLAVILPAFFGPFGLFYTSTFAASIMIFISLLLGLILAAQGNLDSLILFSIILQPLIIFWSVLLLQEKEKNNKVDNETEIKIGGEALIYSLALLFLTLFITLVFSIIFPKNFLQESSTLFYITILSLSIITSITLITNPNNNK